MGKVAEFFGSLAIGLIYLGILTLMSDGKTYFVEYLCAGERTTVTLKNVSQVEVRDQGVYFWRKIEKTKKETDWDLLAIIIEPQAILALKNEEAT